MHLFKHFEDPENPNHTLSDVPLPNLSLQKSLCTSAKISLVRNHSKLFVKHSSNLIYLIFDIHSMRYISIFYHSGIEREYEQKLMPDGRFSVDGFVLVYDVSMVPNRSPEKQTEFCAQVLSNIMKCRPQKPCVIAATKCDEANEILVRELERLVNRKGIRC